MLVVIVLDSRMMRGDMVSAVLMSAVHFVRLATLGVGERAITRHIAEHQKGGGEQAEMFGNATHGGKV